MPRRYCLLLLLLAIVIPAPAQQPTIRFHFGDNPAWAQQPSPTPQPTIRYHFGDNPTWASPTFHDSAWPIAHHGHWPVPPMSSKGFVWLRMQFPLPISSNTPLGLMLSQDHRISSEQVYFQGKLVDQRGQFPPHPAAVFNPVSRVLSVPAALVSAPVATVAIRIWYSTPPRYDGGTARFNLRLGTAPLLLADQRANHLANILGMLPLLSLGALMALIGIPLFLLWIGSRLSELFWFSLLLISFPFSVLPDDLYVVLTRPVPASLHGLVHALTNAVTMLVTVEFLRTIFRLRSRWLRISLHLTWIVFNAALLISSLQVTSPSATSVVVWSLRVGFVALVFFNAITFLIDIRYLILGPNRTIAFGMALIPLGSTLGRLGFEPSFLNIPLFYVGFFLAAFAISALLIRRGISVWHEGNQLRTEMQAAREIQQQLVPLDLPTIPGCQINAVYLPATEVGGDFYQVLPQPDGSTLVFVGDVSGKGLKAAMTGTLAIGALRTIASEHNSPAIVLHKLNRQITRAQQGGFITCLCAHITSNGTLTVANAGHLSPYRNGEEVPLDSGLPLGITDAAEYTQITVQLHPGDTLTFLSDGVVEARNPAGELYGFDRTRSISMQSAEEIAHAASTFGQEDDITVLTLTLTLTPA